MIDNWEYIQRKLREKRQNKYKKKEKQKKILNWWIFVLLVLIFLLPNILINKTKANVFGNIKAVQAKSGLKLRNSPNGKVISSIPFLTKVEVVDENKNGWTKVKHNNKTGFVKTEYLSN